MAKGDTDLLVRLFEQEVPEVASGMVEIKAIGRRAGYRSKLAVHSRDPRVDAVGVCVGPRGHRIKNIVDALGGERIDLFRWDDSPERLIANALQPTTIEEIILHPAEHRAAVIVRSDQRALAQGRQGENRALASELTGWQIEIQVS